MSDVRQVAKVSNARLASNTASLTRNVFRACAFSARLLIFSMPGLSSLWNPVMAETAKANGKSKPAATAPKDATPKPKTDNGKQEILIAQAGPAKAALAQVAATAQAEEVTVLTQADIMKAIRMSRGYEIRVPDIDPYALDGKDYTVFVGKKADFTVVVDYGGGIIIYDGIKRIDARNIADLPEGEAASPAFDMNLQNPSRAGHKRMVLLEIPYKTPQGEEKTLLVKATANGTLGIYTQDESERWKRIGGLSFDESFMNNRTKPLITVRDFVDEDGTYLMIGVYDPKTKQGREVAFAIDDGKVYGMGQNFTGMPLLIQ